MNEHCYARLKAEMTQIEGKMTHVYILCQLRMIPSKFDADTRLKGELIQI